jgi:hypothetical protein
MQDSRCVSPKSRAPGTRLTPRSRRRLDTPNADANASTTTLNRIPTVLVSRSNDTVVELRGSAADPSMPSVEMSWAGSGAHAPPPAYVLCPSAMHAPVPTKTCQVHAGADARRARHIRLRPYTGRALAPGTCPACGHAERASALRALCRSRPLDSMVADAHAPRRSRSRWKRREAGWQSRGPEVSWASSLVS